MTMNRLSYAKALRDAMRNQQISTRELVHRTVLVGAGYGYEHLRKALQGHPSVSEDCNQVLCKILGLDADRMWALATAEKVQRRFGTQPLGMLSPDSDRMRAVWPLLEPTEQECLLKAAEGFVAQRNLVVTCQASHDITRQMSTLSRRLQEMQERHQPAQEVSARAFGAKRKKRRQI